MRLVNDVYVYNGLKLVLGLDDATTVEEIVPVSNELYVLNDVCVYA